MADGNVQRALITDFGAGENTTTATISSVATANAFSRLTNVKFMSAGETAGLGVTTGQNDLGCNCLLTDATTVSFERYSKITSA